MEIPSPCHEAKDQEAVRGLGADLVVGQGEPAEAASTDTKSRGYEVCELRRRGRILSVIEDSGAG